MSRLDDLRELYAILSELDHRLGGARTFGESAALRAYPTAASISSLNQVESDRRAAMAYALSESEPMDSLLDLSPRFANDLPSIKEGCLAVETTEGRSSDYCLARHYWSVTAWDHARLGE